MKKSNREKPKLVVLLGPTASGKTDWGLRLARRFNGDIISADSRQIFTKMSIGTAKPDGVWRREGLMWVYDVAAVPHHLMDIVDPGKQFTLAQFHDAALKCIEHSYKKKRQPIVVGGTGLYIQSLVENLRIPRVPPNKRLRLGLEEKDAASLLALLKKLDPETLRTIDKHNKRRVIRALEVTIMSGEPFSAQRQKDEARFDALQIGIDMPREELYRRIDLRADLMMKNGLLAEVQALNKQKYGWQLPSMSGIGYRQFRPYFEGEATVEEVTAALNRDTRRFAKKQMTWFRRDKSIRWCSSYKEAEKLVVDFLG